MNMNFEHDHISFMSLLAHQQKRWGGVGGGEKEGDIPSHLPQK